MNIFSIKSIGLYSLAIGGTVTFFHFVTSYGEANLKAPVSVAGNYLINGQDLPGCLQQKALLFKTQQSGVYLNASLTVLDRSTGTDISKLIDRSTITKNSNVRPTFSGKLLGRVTSTLPNQKFSLSGPLPPGTCAQSSQLEISGSLAASPTPKQPRQLKGKLAISSGENIPAQSVEFTGIAMPLIRSNEAH